MTTQKTWSKHIDFRVIFAVTVLSLIIALFYLEGKRFQKLAAEPEYLTPDYLVGERIEGTNYTVDGKDTLLIKKNVRVSYTYEILDKKQRKQAYQEIKQLNR